MSDSGAGSDHRIGRIEAGMRVLAVVVAVVAALAARAAPASDARAARPEALLQRIVETARAPGGVMVVSDRYGVWRGTVGVSDRRRGEPMALDRRFRVASVTKMFLATVVLQLAGQGRLRLDDPIGRWLPAAVIGGDRITIRELLSHTSGLYDGGPLDPVPGTFHYDNANYRLLGALVEAATGTSAERTLERRLFRPLRLSHTRWPRTAVPTGVARGYSPAGADVTALPPRTLDSADALVSTAGDLQRFLAALLGGRILAPAQLAAMETPVPVGSSYRPLDDRYGLGLMGFGTRCGEVWGHRGRIAGYTTFAFGSPDGARSIVVLLNVGRVSDAATVRLNRLVFAAFCA